MLAFIQTRPCRVVQRYTPLSFKETDDQKKDRLQKLGGKPNESYIMTHTKIKWRSEQDKTADVIATSSEALANVVATTAGAMPDVVNISSEALAGATTSSDAPTKDTPSVLLLKRIREVLWAAKRTHDSIKRKGPE